MPSTWDIIEAEARAALTGPGSFPIAAYSEFMPAPHVVIKPYDPRRAARAATTTAGDGGGFDVTEYEQARQLDPGLAHVAAHVLGELARLLDGRPHELSRALLADNPAWPAELAATPWPAARRREPLAVALSLALSQTQDDKGNVRWTLFGVSHDGAGAPFWRSLGDRDQDRFAALLGWATATDGAPAALDRVRVLAAPAELPAFARPLARDDGAPLDGVDTVVTFRPFGELPPAIRRGYLAGGLRLYPHPASLVFFHHAGYRRLASALPRATQIPLLHLFPRREDSTGIRIPQSGWLDEHAPEAARAASGHKLVHRVRRSHRWQRVARDGATPVAPALEDRVSIALFSTDADDLGLYGKPMARNAQIWNEAYALVLDGPRATPIEIERADAAVRGGGRFGYRFYFPPMRAGARELFWHRPLIARLTPGAAQTELIGGPPLLGYIHAEPRPGHADSAPLPLAPRLLARAGHDDAARAVSSAPGHARFTTADNVRKVLDVGAALAAPLPPTLARALLHVERHVGVTDWLDGLPGAAADRAAGDRLRAAVAATLGCDVPPAGGLTFGDTATRAFERKLWTTIASLAEGEFRMKETADAVLVNKGKTGGPAARAVSLELAHRRDLDRLGDHLHARHRALIDAHGMTGRARLADHLFHWETDFPFAWSEAWRRNQTREARERNVVVMIPGRDRAQAVVMADHYDTAYMEDVYDRDRGGDGLRAAAAGADDNHSATTALLAAADVLLARAKAGALARDVWLVHLTGEEFPADCQGARALCSALVERRLRLADDDGSLLDVSGVRVTGAFVLDMIAHNSDHDRDVFQIAPGEGAAAARLAARAHRANARWNARVPDWNQAADRRGLGRAERRPDGATPPPPFSHLALRGEIRPEWDPRSALYNTDGQIFSDAGIPVVLFMENYDINRAGYHDTHDTMKNIDLDYAAALTAIAIETVADTATAPEGDL